MNDKALLKTGVIGAVILALCCFTPILAVLVAAVGLSAITGYLDYILLPALIFFVGLTIYAVWHRRNKIKVAEKLEDHG